MQDTQRGIFSLKAYCKNQQSAISSKKLPVTIDKGGPALVLQIFPRKVVLKGSAIKEASDHDFALES